jgi:flagellar biosynthetic protein FliR
MLSQMLSADLFKWLLIFARLGAGAMFLPGFSSAMVLVRMRLLLALMLSFIVLPTLASRLPGPPGQTVALVLMLSSEVAIGIFLGLLAQVMVSALDMAGASIGTSIGLTNVLIADTTTAQQSQLINGFLNLLAITLIFVTDAHHLMLRALVDSYDLLVPGVTPATGDIAHGLVSTLSAATLMGVRLAAPLLVFTLTFNTGLALMNRLVPQIQVFFVGVPIQILGGLTVLMVCVPAIMLLFIKELSQGLGALLNFG